MKRTLHVMMVLASAGVAPAVAQETGEGTAAASKTLGPSGFFEGVSGGPARELADRNGRPSWLQRIYQNRFLVSRRVFECDHRNRVSRGPDSLEKIIGVQCNNRLRGRVVASCDASQERRVCQFVQLCLGEPDSGGVTVESKSHTRMAVSGTQFRFQAGRQGIGKSGGERREVLPQGYSGLVRNCYVRDSPLG